MAHMGNTTSTLRLTVMILDTIGPVRIILSNSRLATVICLCLTALVSRAQIPSNPMPDDTTTVADHIPGSGFLVVSGKQGTLRFAAFATFRYLNQEGLDTTYTDSFGRTSSIRPRNDLQMQKVTLYFQGWLFDPKFRYMFFVWTSNANIGQTANVVIAGNLQYKINDHFDIGAGVAGFPTSRSMLGQWPLWLRQDTRPMAEEFFRGGFTTGFWLQGEIVKGLYYKTTLGNNLNQLGIDAGQLDNKFDTWGTALWWTTGNYSRLASYGDFEKHQKLATILGGAFTRGTETQQSQVGTEAPENSQVRLSDGTGLFSRNAFNNGSSVLSAKYQMLSLNGGVKYKGLSFDVEYYLRWLTDLKAQGALPVSRLFDHGYSVQASGMLIDKTLQAYSTGSYVIGQYGKPWEIAGGLNWFPFKNRMMRINPEIMFVNRSPVGYLSYPTVVGATGSVLMLNLELYY